MRRGTPALLALLALGPASAAPAQVPPPPHRPPAGVVRVWSTAEAGPLIAAWTRRFVLQHPGTRVLAKPAGSDVAMAGLYTGQADIALIGREATESEVKAFEWVFRYRPTAVDVLTGSVGRAGHSPALVVFVHRDNPIDRLRLDQLEAVFGQEHRRSPANVRTWGELGLPEPWAGREIRLYAPSSESGTGRFFRAKVLGDSNKMNWDHLTEFDDPVRSGGASDDSGRRILEALARDRFGMAVANLRDAGPDVKQVALGASPGGEFHAATRDDVIERRYALARGVYAYVNLPPGDGLDAQVAEFLEYVLGADGQGVAAGLDGYLPLAPRLLAGERKKIVYSSLRRSSRTMAAGSGR